MAGGTAERPIVPKIPRDATEEKSHSGRTEVESTRDDRKSFLFCARVSGPRNVSSTREAPRALGVAAGRHTHGRAAEARRARRARASARLARRVASWPPPRTEDGASSKRSTERARFMSEDLRAALAASERRTARAEEEARVARHERDEAVASAARLREALRTFAEDADLPPPEDDREETHDDLLFFRAEEHDQRPSDSTTTNDPTTSSARELIAYDASEASSLRSEISSLRAKLRSALESARRARNDADEASRASTASRLERDAAVARLEASRKENEEMKRRVESANAATALARRQVAETSASLRRGLGVVSGDEKDPKREHVSETCDKASDDVRSDALEKKKRDEDEAKDDAVSARAAKEKETFATLAAMEATVARLASTLRAREKELDDTRATVATLVRERGERERAFEERLRFSGRPDELKQKRRSPAAAALAEARTLANRNRRDRPVSRARAFTSTKSHEYE